MFGPRNNPRKPLVLGRAWHRCKFVFFLLRETNHPYHLTMQDSMRASQTSYLGRHDKDFARERDVLLLTRFWTIYHRAGQTPAVAS